jgi:hypothetical protein
MSEELNELEAAIADDQKEGTANEESAPPGSEETQQESGKEVQGEAQEADPEKKESGIQTRINELVGKYHGEKRRADYLEQEIEKLKTQQKPSSWVKEPKIEDYDYDESKYQQALIDYRVDQRLNAQQISYAQEKAKAKRQEAQKSFAQKVAKANIPNYAQVAQTLIESIPLQWDITKAIQADEKGPELVVYLGKHLDFAEKINAMEPSVAALELGKLSAKLGPVQPTKKKSNAPTPVKTIKSGGSGSSKSLEEMSMEEIMNL